MKKLRQIYYSLLLIFLTPSLLFASTTYGGGALASQIKAVGILRQIAGFLSGPLLITVAIVAGIIAGYGFLKKNRGHGERWQGLYRVGMFLVIVTSIGGVVKLLFSGVTI